MALFLSACMHKEKPDIIGPQVYEPIKANGNIVVTMEVFKNFKVA